MDDDGHAISYKVLASGTEVRSSDGEVVGFVARVLENDREHIFDGIVIRTKGGDRFVVTPGQRSLEVVGHELHELLAGQWIAAAQPHEVGSIAFRWRSIAPLTFERALCKRTLWFVSLISKALRTSSEDQ